jgi:hypothetical protein
VDLWSSNLFDGDSIVFDLSYNNNSAYPSKLTKTKIHYGNNYSVSTNEFYMFYDNQHRIISLNSTNDSSKSFAYTFNYGSNYITAKSATSCYADSFTIINSTYDKIIKVSGCANPQLIGNASNNNQFFSNLSFNYQGNPAYNPIIGNSYGIIFNCGGDLQLGVNLIYLNFVEKYSTEIQYAASNNNLIRDNLNRPIKVTSSSSAYTTYSYY